MFGTQDTFAHFKHIFKKYYADTIDFCGPHTMTAENIRNDLVPAIHKMLEEVKPIDERYFRHFKGGKYRLWKIAKDSETLDRMVVYQALYGNCGYWVRPEKMFFERVTRDGESFPRCLVCLRQVARFQLPGQTLSYSVCGYNGIAIRVYGETYMTDFDIPILSFACDNRFIIQNPATTQINYVATLQSQISSDSVFAKGCSM